MMEMFRFIILSLTTFLIPGFLFRAAFFRQAHFNRIVQSLSWWSHSVFWSLVLLVITGFFAFSFQITLPNALLYFWTAIGLLAVFISFKYRGKKESLIGSSLKPTSLSYYSFALVCVSFCLGLLLWASGQNFESVGGELGLHAGFVTLYSSGEPLHYKRMCVSPDFFPPNFFQGWEFIVAFLSTQAKVSAFDAFNCIRFFVPTLALLGNYLVFESLGFSKRRALVATTIALIFVVTQFVHISPNIIIGSGFEEGYFRGIYGWLGSSHHGDIAIDIILPFLFAALIQLIRNPCLGTSFAFGLFLLATFFIHPRELFNLSIAAPFLIAFLVRWKKEIVKKVTFSWIVTTGLVLAFVFALQVILNEKNTELHTHVGDQLLFAQQWIPELKNFRSWLINALPFQFYYPDFPVEVGADPSKYPLMLSWMVFPVLLGFGIPFLTRTVRGLAAFCFVFWILFFLMTGPQILLRLTFPVVSSHKFRLLYPMIWIVLCCLPIGIVQFYSGLFTQIKKRIPSFCLEMFSVLGLAITILVCGFLFKWEKLWNPKGQILLAVLFAGATVLSVLSWAASINRARINRFLSRYTFFDAWTKQLKNFVQMCRHRVLTKKQYLGSFIGLLIALLFVGREDIRAISRLMLKNIREQSFQENVILEKYGANQEWLSCLKGEKRVRFKRIATDPINHLPLYWVLPLYEVPLTGNVNLYIDQFNDRKAGKHILYDQFLGFEAEKVFPYNAKTEEFIAKWSLQGILVDTQRVPRALRNLEAIGFKTNLICPKINPYWELILFERK